MEPAGEPPVVVGAVERQGRRVAADIDGTTVWFESADVALVPSPEAFASAVLVAAAATGRAVQVVEPTTRRWQAGTAKILRTIDDWWGWHAPAPVSPSRRRRRRRPKVLATCFSGGADSFHVLRTATPAPSVAVTALGFDVSLSDTARCRSMENDVRAVGGALGVRSVVVRTNLLDHPLHQATDWSYTHGGPLAALGHLLSDDIGELLIAASHPVDFPRPWGSHWELDSCWSSDVTIRHTGEQRWRAEKLAVMRHDPVVQAHLRVCWEHATSEVNCGQCEKCVRTACDLLTYDGLQGFDRLPQADVLAARIDGLPPASTALIAYQRMLERSLPSDVRAAVERLVARSEGTTP